MTADPIDLHSLAVLMNYERTATEPRYRHYKLFEVAGPDGTFVSKDPGMDDLWPERPSRHRRGFIFGYMRPESMEEISSPDSPSNMVMKEVPADHIQNISDKEKETIFWEVRSHDGCYTSLNLIQSVLALFPVGQSLLIRLHNGKSFISAANPADQVAFEFRMTNSKVCSSTRLLNTFEIPGKMSMKGYSTGFDDISKHIVWAFYDSSADAAAEGEAVILDLSSMQFGNAGRGRGGEFFRFDRLEPDYRKFLATVVERAEKVNEFQYINKDHKHQDWIEEIAKRVKERWDERENNPWCAQCGSPSPPKRCPCGKVFYCGESHQKLNWAYHKNWHSA